MYVSNWLNKGHFGCHSNGACEKCLWSVSFGLIKCEKLLRHVAHLNVTCTCTHAAVQWKSSSSSAHTAKLYQCVYSAHIYVCYIKHMQSTHGAIYINAASVWPYFSSNRKLIECASQLSSSQATIHCIQYTLKIYYARTLRCATRCYYMLNCNCVFLWHYTIYVQA